MTVSKNPAAIATLIAAVWATVMDLLRDEAREALTRDAEAEASEGKDAGALALKWYGVQLNRHEERTLRNEIIALELAEKRVLEQLEVYDIRQRFDGEDTFKDEIADYKNELKEIRATLYAKDDQVATLHFETEAAVEATRTLLVEAKAETLKDEYLCLSADMPFNVWHPAVPEFLRTWIRRQEARGAVKAVDAYRVLLYLVLRDTVFTGIWNVPPVIEDDELPTDNPLEEAARPLSKKEARWQKLIDVQFIHSNGDRRVARDSQLMQLHESRLDAKEQGKPFADRFDFEASSDYDGVPTLKNLLNPELKLCAECGAAIHDNIVIPHTDDNGRLAYRGVNRCECTTDILTPDFDKRDDATEYLLRRIGKEDVVVHFRERRARLRREREAA